MVAPPVYAATKGVIDYRELEPLRLKGKQEPVPAWQALRVGLLRQTFHRVEVEGKPVLGTVLGSAGVGKSRLSDELLAHLESLPTLAYWRRGRCLAYGNVSYSALADAVKAQCEILEDDPPDIVITKVRRLVGSDRLRGPGEGHPAGFALQALGIVPADRSLVERAAERFAALGFDGEAAATLASGPEGWCPGEASPIIAVGP